MIEAPYHEARDTDPVLPAARGVVSEAVLSALRDRHESWVSSRAVETQTTSLLAVRPAEFPLAAWQEGRSALRIPLATTAPHAGRP